MARRNTLHRRSRALLLAQDLRHAVCLEQMMMTMMTIPQMTLMFLGTVVSLGAALVWMFWELRKPALLARSRGRLDRR